MSSVINYCQHTRLYWVETRHSTTGESLRSGYCPDCKESFLAPVPVPGAFTVSARAEPYTDISPADHYRDALKRIAEIDGPIECTSLQDWQRKVKTMAANALKGKP